MNNKLLKLKTAIQEQNLGGLLVSTVPNIIYLTGFSAFSIEEREAFLVITKTNQYIITDGRYTEAVSAQVKNFTLLQTAQGEPAKAHIQKVCKKHSIQLLGFEETNLTVAEFTGFSKELKGTAKLVPTDHTIEQIRAIKTAEEVNAIQKACKLGDDGFDFILGKLKPGVTEQEMAVELEFFLKKHKGDSSFPAIVAFGSHSSIPHHQPTDRKLKASDWILLDFGAKLDNYCSDMTRTVFMGKAGEEQKKMYQTVTDAQQKTIQQLNNLAMKQSEILIQASKIDNIARSHIVSQGYQTIPHSLGHGTGIEVHELPRLSPTGKDMLEVGNVFSVEPGIYIPDFGGVRIEDLVVLEHTGINQLTKSHKNLIEL